MWRSLQPRFQPLGLPARSSTAKRITLADWGALLTAAFVAVIPFNIQVSHFYAVDTPLLFFVLLTLLGCVLLAQDGAAGGRSQNAPTNDGPRQAAIDAESRFQSSGRFYLIALFTGVAFGLAMATKVSALPLLAPIAVALLLRWRRTGFEEAFVALLAIGAAALATFLLTSPYAILDFSTFQQQVGEQTALSQGKLDYPYVRQFAGTTPYLYEIVQMLLYDMGLPLGLLGLVGFAWAASRLWQSLDDDWAIIVVWIAAYFAVVGSAYTKFTRYMLPVFAPLALCGAAALIALAVWGYRWLSSLPRADGIISATPGEGIAPAIAGGTSALETTGGTSPAPTVLDGPDALLEDTLPRARAVRARHRRATSTNVDAGEMGETDLAPTADSHVQASADPRRRVLRDRRGVLRTSSLSQPPDIRPPNIRPPGILSRILAPSPTCGVRAGGR